jgi:hypothetical protein
VTPDPSVQEADEALIAQLVEDLPSLAPLLDEHLADMDGEILPYLLLADVARWAQASYATDPTQVGALVDWLEDAWRSADAGPRATRPRADSGRRGAGSADAARRPRLIPQHHPDARAGRPGWVD